MYLLFTSLPVAGTSGKFKIDSKMATNNKNGPLNNNNISNFHSVHNSLHFNTFVFIRYNTKCLQRKNLNMLQFQLSNKCSYQNLD